MKFFSLILILLQFPFAHLVVSNERESNLSLVINRRLVHRFTDVLKKQTPGLESIIFDLKDQRLDMTVILKQAEIPFLRFVTPTYKPGEIFEHNSDRQGVVLAEDVQNFLVGFQFSFAIEMKPEEPDAAYLSFEQPMVAAYYIQDLEEYKQILLKLGDVVARGDALRQKIVRLNVELGELLGANGGAENKIRLLKEKIRLHTEYALNSDEEYLLQQKANRFSSGSHLNLLPSDQALAGLLKSVEGRKTGDDILDDVYKKVQRMQVIHEGLALRLVGQIKNRRGVLKVSNLGSVLAGYLPGLMITHAEIQKLPPLPNEEGGRPTVRSGDYQLVFEGKVPPRRRKK